jgi:eukaryotic-like serine/threonine-protein kinase
VVAGRYRLGRRVGGGGMGEVWQAWDERLGRDVVVKRLPLAPRWSGEDLERASRRVMREGRIAARLAHRNAVAVYDVLEDGGQPVLVMEYVPGRDLAQVLAERGTLPPAEAAEIGAQVAAGLAAAHAVGIVHRDVKPANILFAEDGTAKITDFGISRISGDSAVTASGLLVGTPAFMAPETASGHDPTPASDVFSLGSTLYAAVEGRPPFGLPDNPIAALHAVAAGPVTPPARAGALTGPLLRMLQRDPAARPTMAQVAQLLRTVADRPADTLALTAVTPGEAVTSGAPGAAAKPATTVAAGQPARIGPPVPPPPSLRLPAAVRRHKVAILVAAVLVATVALGLLVHGLSTTESSGLIGGNAAASSQAPAGADAAAKRAVTDYYALLPAHPDQAWTRLGPSLQAQGQDRYTQFWQDVTEVRIVEPPMAAGDGVRVGIELAFTDGGRVREVHLLGALRRDDAVLLDSDQVLSSQRIDDGEDKKDGGKGKDKKKEGGG